MKKFTILALSIATLACASLTAFASDFGFVNFKHCIEKSKQGVQERNAFEALKKQLSDALQKSDKELEDLAKKLQDQDYMDGLSPGAEDELKQRFQALSQEFSRYQNQYYQLLNQANMRMIQSMHDSVCNAAEKIRDQHNLSFLFNEDSTFACAPAFNFTDEVIQELDKRFDLANTETAGLDNAAGK